MQWFDVDKQGLAKLLERRGKFWALCELLQNAWDTATTNVHIEVQRLANSPFVTLEVKDDNLEGFLDLTESFTLFAESAKKGDPTKRGRFNLGEKLVLAMCDEAEIVSTTGTIRFDGTGRHRSSKKIAAGTVFFGQLRMTNAEIEDSYKAITRLIGPTGILTTFKIGSHEGSIANPVPLTSFEDTLATEIADAEGILRRTSRKTEIVIYNARGEQAYLYEMGIPVVEIDGRFHVNVMQKVPLNFDRDNVTPAYLAKVHALTVEHTRDFLTGDDVNQAWVRVAMQEQPDVLSNETVRQIADLRFGKDRVSYDPSDREANSLAASKGYQVLHGGVMSGAEWDLMRRADAVQPAGQVTPSKPEGFEAAIPVPIDQWTDAMLHVSQYTRVLAKRLMGVELSVRMINNPNVTSCASYGPVGSATPQFTFNIGRLSEHTKWFEGPLAEINNLILHEFGHQYSGDHLSARYHEALTRLGGRLTQLALERPIFFEPVRKVTLGTPIWRFQLSATG